MEVRVVESWPVADPAVLGHQDDPAAHHQGVYALERRSSLVAAALRTKRSPVQQYARQAPASCLFWCR